VDQPTLRFELHTQWAKSPKKQSVGVYFHYIEIPTEGDRPECIAFTKISI